MIARDGVADIIDIDYSSEVTPVILATRRVARALLSLRTHRFG